MDKLITNLDTNLGAVLREQLDTNFQKIQNGVDGQADSLNKQILDMLGNVAPQDQNEVTQARIDANGKLYDTLKGREDATQATAETALSEERDTLVEVQNARTNSISQTYPTLKERMDSQENELNNNINSRLAQINVNPEFFTNLNELATKYPNGKEGVFILDNGHTAIYQKGWQDSGHSITVGSFQFKAFVDVNEVTAPYDSLDTLPTNSVIFYAPEVTEKFLASPTNEGKKAIIAITLGADASYRRCCQDYGQVFSTPQGAATPKNFQNPDFSLKWRDFWVFL